MFKIARGLRGSHLQKLLRPYPDLQYDIPAWIVTRKVIVSSLKWPKQPCQGPRTVKCQNNYPVIIVFNRTRESGPFLFYYFLMFFLKNFFISENYREVWHLSNPPLTQHLSVVRKKQNFGWTNEWMNKLTNWRKDILKQVTIIQTD